MQSTQKFFSFCFRVSKKFSGEKIRENDNFKIFLRFVMPKGEKGRSWNFCFKNRIAQLNSNNRKKFLPRHLGAKNEWDLLVFKGGLPDGFFSNPKSQNLLVNFRGPQIGNCWYILRPFWIFYRHLGYFMNIGNILCSLGTFFLVLVSCTKKNLAARRVSKASWDLGFTGFKTHFSLSLFFDTLYIIST
jgi:hypothetical protein